MNYMIETHPIPLTPLTEDEQHILSQTGEIITAAQLFTRRRMGFPLASVSDHFMTAVANRYPGAADYAYAQLSGELMVEQSAAVTDAHEALNIKRAFMAVSRNTNNLALQKVEDQITLIEKVADNTLEQALNAYANADQWLQQPEMAEPTNNFLRYQYQRLDRSNAIVHGPVPQDASSRYKALIAANSQILTSYERLSVLQLREISLDIGYYTHVYGTSASPQVAFNEGSCWQERKTYTDHVLKPQLMLLDLYAQTRAYFTEENNALRQARVLSVN